ncbi:LacI family DNA-binding transcriptional regulator [Cohnella nanjingensis]|uniref:LacI family DNA-binding transcriptional regulator n=1 Tax=Cohnella nanjingensis TaxID=1387779 RepID=A0A7X0RPV4_9BACL|nr:LacI family DNA-binding transcriptional regulator [Cohnella nanjingensis]MBB6671447.1 LacI family DNA-binding transcriptional regulator [Cohnella nanjingensis]
MAKGRTTMKDIAQALGVTPSTVSLAMKDDPRISLETKQRVMSMARTMNFRLNPHMANLNQKTHTIGISIYGFDFANHPFIGGMIGGIQAEAGKHGFSVMLCNNNTERIGNSNKSFFVNLAEEGRIDGLIIHRGHAEDIRKVTNLGIPVVLLNTHHESLPDIPVVHVDFEHAIYAATEHLIESLGHGRIGFIGSSLYDQVGRKGLEGYKTALEKYGLPYDESKIRFAEYDDPEQEYKMAYDLLSSEDRPTAVVTIDDYFAMYTINAAYDLGLSVPEELSVTGVYDFPTSAMLSKPLTTIRIPLDELGMKAFHLLNQQLQGTEIPQKQYWIRGDLITRKTTRFVKS